MKTIPSALTSRRGFIKQTGQLAAAAALAGVAVPSVHAAEDNTIRLALIGCGGRGRGAAANAMSAGGLVLGDEPAARTPGSAANGPVKLIAMADLRPAQIASAHQSLTKRLGSLIDVPAERQFVGFDAYRNAIDCLRPGDVALLTTHAAFRAPHLEYAVEKGVNVFMEKDFAADPGGIKRILKAGEAAEKKNLKVSAGLMCRHSSARQAMIQKIRDGEMGQIQLIRAYRMDPGYFMSRFPGGGENELLWQLTPGRPFQFMWASGGIFIELMIHQIDECFWIKDSYPVAAHGIGGRYADSGDCSQNLDSYAVEYTFADGTKAMVNGRYIPNCHTDFSTVLHGTKCAGDFSGSTHDATCWMYKDQRIGRDNIAWKAPKEAGNPWQAEWDVLLSAIRNDRPHNEAKRAALSNLGAIMGRAAVHMGKIITWEQAMASDFQFCADVGKLTASSPAPVQADAKGRYPAPVPGRWVEV